jgi:hypothetical protein
VLLIKPKSRSEELQQQPAEKSDHFNNNENNRTDCTSFY